MSTTIMTIFAFYNIKFYSYVGWYDDHFKKNLQQIWQ